MTARLTGIGIGPGDPELITVKALKRLEAADLLVYPAPETGESLARQIVAPLLPGGQAEWAMRMPMRADRFPAMDVYDATARRIETALAADEDVVVICEGDPFFYGSFMYLFQRMQQSRWPVEVIPGVSSLTAGAAMLGLPLAARNDILTVLPAPLPEDLLRQHICAADCVVFIKLGRHFAKVKSLIAQLGLLERAYYIERATMHHQQVHQLCTVSPVSVPYFSMIYVHGYRAAVGDAVGDRP